MWGFPASHGLPQGWMVGFFLEHRLEHPNHKWMMTRGTHPFLVHPFLRLGCTDFPSIQPWDQQSRGEQMLQVELQVGDESKPRNLETSKRRSVETDFSKLL